MIHRIPPFQILGVVTINRTSSSDQLLDDLHSFEFQNPVPAGHDKPLV